MQVHDGVVGALNGVDSLVIMDTDQKVVTQLLGTLQELDVASVEKIKGAVNVHNLVTVLGFLALRELNNLARSRENVRDLGGRGGREGAELGRVNRSDRGGVDRATALVMVASHEQHTAHQLGGRDILGALALSIERKQDAS